MVRCCSDSYLRFPPGRAASLRQQGSAILVPTPDVGIVPETDELVLKELAGKLRAPTGSPRGMQTNAAIIIVTVI
jgi:hypothetical protein